MTAISESELDSLYGELCRAITEVGEARAPLLLARFSLLAMGEIADAERVRYILTSARDFEAATDHTVVSVLGESSPR
jgi:hypothetical protein